MTTLRGVRLLADAFLRGDSMATVADDCGVRRDVVELSIRQYLGRLTEQPRTHWHGGSCPGLRKRKHTRDKDRVTCRRCIRRLKGQGRWE